LHASRCFPYTTLFRSLLAPRIEVAFEDERIIYGDNSLMRWYVNNVYVKILPNGNKVYRKKEEVKRKTDGFMMFLYGMWASRDLEDRKSTRLNSSHVKN